MRVLSGHELSCVGGTGAGQEIYQCMQEADDQMGWVGIAAAFVAPWQPGLAAAYTGGLFVGCALLYLNGC